MHIEGIMVRIIIDKLNFREIILYKIKIKLISRIIKILLISSQVKELHQY